MKKIVYLTGGIATGKSTVAKIFEELGAKVIDADKIVHKLLEEDEAVKSEIVKIFGQDILENGKINRRKLGAIVFADRSKLSVLEKITHPKVLEIMSKQISESDEELVVLEIPLLFEKQMNLKPSVVVYCPAHIQIKRMKERDNLSDEEIRNRLNSQIDIEKKKEMADYVVDNSGSLEETREQVRKLIDKLLTQWSF
ncbi:MAG: dephospho-CoA kinase [Candidatus Calescibacterium sp.]|nr:dephospho-CoA kinase [Candidatus Calescibacterium sp.]MDW8086460.1 dephospho-CoA kinase [Candidatus Calescibacterium sp.]